ncbi:hypothetical protein EOD39_7343 [Acipenser ruthenus]|uniref:Alpha-ketoglutarate-dependent dioxygenase FTO catalytic domain-containing protein n=1 Tax=Acipenser ruthenus TaxID=7906 RepID=A0A662Z089_ACIRT|nr:hypothetical protein EOD39_7343 [Acipenser ruthenus]
MADRRIVGVRIEWKNKYSKLALKEAHSTPPELQGPVQTGLSTLLERGCLFRDLVQMKGVRYCDDEVARACQAVKDLNDYLCVEAERCLTRREGAQSTAETTASVTREKEREANNRTVFNVTLLNYMDRAGMSYLKEEP